MLSKFQACLAFVCIVLAVAPSFAYESKPFDVFGQDVNSYYDGLQPNSGDFKKDLHRLLANGTRVLSYADIWTAFGQSDIDFPSCGGQVRDIYAKQCWTFGKGQCGNYKREGDCYNREHSWPKSWWGSQHNAAYTDLHHLYPADGYVNNRRGSLPLGTVSNPDYVSTDGSKVGNCDRNLGISSRCFEPSDSFKGEISRTYFYMAVRFMTEFTCCDMKGVNGAEIKPWMESVLRMWHEQYPPTDAELRRNDIVYRLQRNRNPFVDHPEWVGKISNF